MNDFVRKYQYVIIAIILLVVGGVILFTINLNQDEIVAPEESDISVVDIAGDGAEIEVIPFNDPGVLVPEIRRAVEFPVGMDIVAKNDIELRLGRAIAALEEDYLDADSWNELGVLRKAIEDYTGAIEAWEYGSLLNENSIVPVLNIAGTYGYFLRDFDLAEKYYRKAIERNRASLQAYGQAYEFFSGVMQDQEKAISIIDLGIKNNPSSLELKEFRETITNK